MIRLAKISLVVLTTLTMNFSSAGLALAQTGNTPAPLPVSNSFTIPNVGTQVPLSQPPAAADPKKLQKADLVAAHGGPEACGTFSGKLMQLTQSDFKAYWPITYSPDSRGLSGLATWNPQPVPAGEGVECVIVPSNFEDHPALGFSARVRLGDPSEQPEFAKNFQTLIMNSEAGVSESELLKAKAAASEERTQASGFSRVAGWFINALFSVVASFLAAITSIAGQILVVAIDWTTHSATPNIVQVGWEIIRDFANMFFILVMIVIGLAAILRLEQYDYRHLLGEVILMAILVNFSKVIAETIIDFSNFLVTLFYNFDFFDIFLFLQNVAYGGLSDFSSGGWMSALVQGMTKLVFMVITCGVFLILAGMFTVRLVGLYVLVILSPMAYILDILPVTKDLAHQWWHKFIEYIIWAPVAMFMLRLCMLIVDGSGLQTASLVSGASSGFAGISNDSIFNYGILAAFMIAAVLVAEHAGMVGGNAVVHGVEHFGHWAGHSVGHYAGRKWNEWTTHTFLEQHGNDPVSTRSKVAFALLNPVSVFKGATQRGHELTHMAQELATAGGREVAEQFVTGGMKGKTPQLQIPYRQFVERKDEDNFLKDYGNMKKESLMQAALQAEEMGGPEGFTRRRAIIKASAANGYLDDILRMKHFAQKHGDADGTIYSAEVLNRFLFDYLGDNEQSKRFMAEDMEELGRKTKHFEYMGHAYYDTESKTFRRGMEVEPGGKIAGLKDDEGNQMEVDKLKNTWQASYAASEFGKQGGRDRVAAAPHNLTTIRAELDADGQIITDIKDDGTLVKGQGQISHAVFGRKDGSIDVYSKKILEKMDADVMREIQHTQERVKHWILSKEKARPDGTIIVESEEAYKQIEEMYKVNPEFVLGLYTKALGVKRDQWQELGGIKVSIKQTQVIDGKLVTVEGPSRIGGDIGKPKFKDIEELRAGKKSSSATAAAATPATP